MDDFAQKITGAFSFRQSPDAVDKHHGLSFVSVMFLSYSQLSNILGISYPLLMLDQVFFNEDDNSAIGRKMVSMGEPHFLGHFPAQPIMPGVLIVAAMTQLSKVIFHHVIPAIGGTTVVLKELKRIKFRKPVFPGMVLSIKSEIIGRNEDNDVEFKVSCLTDDESTACVGTIILGCITETSEENCENTAPEFAAGFAAMNHLDALQLMDILPHRPPFLLLDGAYGIGADSGVAYGVKNVSGNDALIGNRGTAPRFPGYLLVEACAQLGCTQALSVPENRNKLGIFMGIDSAQFTGGIFPGDRLYIRIETECAGQGGFASAQCLAGKRPVAQCQLKFIITEKL